MTNFVREFQNYALQLFKEMNSEQNNINLILIAQKLE